MKHLIVTADDFGLTREVNQAIIEAFREGIVTSTSLLVNMSAFEEAVHSAWSLPRLGIGLHVNLTSGRPVLDPQRVPSLVEADGTFRGPHSAGNRNPVEVREEVDAQWDRFIDTGLYPTHLDTRHLLHQNDPVVYKVMAEKAIHEKVPLRRSQIEHSIMQTPVPVMTDYVLLDIYNDEGGLTRLLSYLKSLPIGTTELVVHPGNGEKGVVQTHELAVLCDPVLNKILDANGIVLDTYEILEERLESSHYHRRGIPVRSRYVRKKRRRPLPAARKPVWKR